MDWKRGTGVGFVLVKARPHELLVVLVGGAASEEPQVRIFAQEKTANLEARRLQSELRDPWIQLAELVLHAEPEVLV